MINELKIIYGRAGSGKSTKIHSQIKACVESGARAVLIVPEQLTFESEKQLSKTLSGGLFDAEVFSFASIARTVFRETGLHRVPLSPQGRLMIIRKACETVRLSTFAAVKNHRGFSKKCDELIRGFQNFDISPEQLNIAIEKLEEGSALREKLKDICAIYENITEYISGDYMDDAEAMTVLSVLLKDSSLARRHVFIDGVERYNEKTYAVINSLIDCASSLTVSMRFDTLENNGADIFLAEKKAFLRIADMAQQRGIKLVTQKTDDFALRECKPEFLHLERELFSMPVHPYRRDENAPADAFALPPIRFFAAKDVQSEVYNLTCAVQDAARRGIRYSEMAVIAGDTARYLMPVSQAFSREHIPLFADERHPLAAKPEAMLILCALHAVMRGFFRDDVLALLKTGLLGVHPDDAEIFENYVLRYGISGSAFCAPFFKGEVPEAAELARAVIMHPLLKLKEGLSLPTVGEKAQALYAYLTELCVPDRLQEKLDILQNEGRFALTDENAQLWEALTSLFTQLYAIMGKLELTLPRFYALMQEGIASYEVGVIPATADRVLFGSVDRTRMPEIKALFVIGMNEGLMPKALSDDGVIDDRELTRLGELGLPVWEDTDAVSLREKTDIYIMLSKPSQSLYVSYAMSAGGSEAMPSPVFMQLREIFPDVRQKTSLENDTELLPSGGKSAFRELAHLLRRFADTGEASETTAQLIACFSSDPRYMDRLKALTDAVYFDPDPTGIDELIAKKLYGETTSTSASRLEQFNQCPFRHFVTYGLRAKQRPEYKERAIDLGSFYHEVMDCFAKAIIAGGIDPKRFSREECEQLIDELVPRVIETHNNGYLLDTPKTRSAAMAMTSRVKSTAWAMIAQLAAGDFKLLASELSFGKNADFPPIRIELDDGKTLELSGKIDRVDGYTDASALQYLRVIDYKLGGREFSYPELFCGVYLQLPLYMSALSGLSRAFAGLLYAPIRSEVTDECENEKELAAKLQSELRLNGLLLSDVNVLRAMDGISEQSSPVIRVTFKKDGTPRASELLTSKEELDVIARFSLQKAKRSAEAIFSGDIHIKPYRFDQRRNACSHCDYIDICSFDRKLRCCEYNDKRKLSKEDFFLATCSIDDLIAENK